MKRKGLATLLVLILLAGCSSTNSAPPITDRYKGSTANEQHGNLTQYEGEPSRVVKHVYTTARKMALSFEGLPDKDKLKKVLDELDRYQAKATFFVTGMRAAEEPELLKEIEKRGHEVQSLGLKRHNYNDSTYQEMAQTMQLGKQTIEQALEHELQYVRAVTSEPNEMLGLAAAYSGYDAVIGYSLFLKDSDLDEQFTSAKDLRIFITRGGIVCIDLERNSRIDELLALVHEAVSEVGYELATVSAVMQDELEYKPFDEIEGGDFAKINPATADTTYTVVENGDRSINEVSLTIDDWGTDYTVTQIIDILTEYDVPATFFVRVNGAERNPSLARSILEAGFEVANHTYSHPVITTISDEELQEEVVKAHQILTEALQQPPLKLFRPPTGAFDERSARTVAATGYTTIADYDLTTKDWDNTNDAHDILQTVLDNVQNGSIILIHMLDDIHTVEALPQIIEEVRARGYTFVPMSKMVEDAQKQ